MFTVPINFTSFLKLITRTTWVGVPKVNEIMIALDGSLYIGFGQSASNVISTINLVELGYVCPVVCTNMTCSGGVLCFCFERIDYTSLMTAEITGRDIYNMILTARKKDTHKIFLMPDNKHYTLEVAEKNLDKVVGNIKLSGINLLISFKD